MGLKPSKLLGQSTYGISAINVALKLPCTLLEILTSSNTLRKSSPNNSKILK